MVLNRVFGPLVGVILATLLTPVTRWNRIAPSEDISARGRNAATALIAAGYSGTKARLSASACPTTIEINWPVAGTDTTYTQLLGAQFGQGDDPETGPCEEILYDYQSFRLYVNSIDRTSYVTSLNEDGAEATSGLVDQTLNIIRVTIDGLDVSGNPVTVEDVDTVHVNTTPKPLVDLGFNNTDNQSRALCAADCFSVVQTVSTVPYFSLDEPRSVTLMYDGERAHARPFIYADVSIPSGAIAPQEFWLQAKVKWSATYDDVTFTNGDATVKFGGSTQPRRLGAQIDASGRATGAYPMQIIVSAKYSSSTVSHTVTTRLIVVNERTSPVARGWAIAGLPRLVSIGDTAALLVDGLGSATYFGSRTCGATVCTYSSPVGDFSVLTDSASSTNKVYVRAYPDSSKVRFNHIGRATEISSRRGERTALEYDGSQRLVKVYDPHRKVAGTSDKAYNRLFYGAAGLDSIVSAGPTGTEANGRTTRFTIANSDSTLRAVRDPDGDSTSFSYDASKRLASVTDRRGSTTTIAYNAFWMAASVSLPQVPIDAGGGSTQSMTLSSSFRPWQIVGVPSASTASTPATAASADSMRGLLVSPSGDTTILAVNKWGMPTKITDPLSGVTQFTYLSTLPTLPTQVSRTAQGVSHFSYYTDRGLVATYRGPGQDSVLRLAYGPYAQLDSTWGYLRPHVRYFRTNTASERGRTDSVRVNFDANRVTRYLYDSLVRLTTVVGPAGDSVHYHYDAVFGNLDSSRTGSGEWRKILLDRFGRDSVTMTAGLASAIAVYDVMNRITHAYDSAGASPTVYGYDGLFMTRVQDPLGQVYRYAYNALGWITQRFDPADTLNRFESYRYNSQGLVTSVTNRRGQRVDQTFDNLGRLLSRSGTNVQADSFGYSQDRRKVAYWNAVSRDSLFYSEEGWLDSAVTRIAGRRFRRFNAPDPLGRLDSASVLGQLGAPSMLSRRAIWNASLGTLDTILVGTASTGFRYDQKFRRDSTAWSVGNARKVSFTNGDDLYDESLRTSGGTPLIRRGYGRDSLGRIAQALDSTGTAIKGRAFGYDPLGRLASEIFFSLGSFCSSTTVAGYLCAYSSDSSKTYRHDAVGNDTSGNVYATGNRLTSWGGVAFEHDLDGNRTRRCDLPVSGLCTNSDIRYEFSATNRLRKVIAAGDTTEYDYNAVGELVRVRRNGAVVRYYLWDNGHLLAELNDTASQRIAQYVFGRGTDQAHALVTGGAEIRYFAQDAFGSTDGLFAGATVHQRRTYDPWGAVVASSGAVADTNRLGWKGLLYEGDSTRLYYMRNRWFDPQTRRFVSEDPIGLDGGINLYLFASGEPLNNWDPTGLADCKFEYTGPNCPPGTYLHGVTITAGGSDPWGGFFGGGGAGGGAEGIAGSADPRAVQDADDHRQEGESAAGESSSTSNEPSDPQPTFAQCMRDAGGKTLAFLTGGVGALLRYAGKGVHKLGIQGLLNANVDLLGSRVGSEAYARAAWYASNARFYIAAGAVMTKVGTVVAAGAVAYVVGTSLVCAVNPNAYR